MYEHPAPNDELAANLNKQKAELEKFRDRVSALKSNIAYRQQHAGNRIYYTVDFSEIYSYLHYGDPDVTDFGMSVTSTKDELPSKAGEHHYLALTHLFNSFSSAPLYLLQPYVLEMYSYTRMQAHQSLRNERRLGDLLVSCAASLKPDHRRLLQGMESPEALTQVQRKDLLEEFASDYPTLSIDLLEYDRWREENTKLKNRGQLLKVMLVKRKISHRLDEMLAECGVHPSRLAEPTVAEEKTLADMFPGHPNEGSRKFSRLLDARAVLLLRNINRLLEPLNARLILVTRDTKSPKIAERLEGEEWFGWKNVKEFFYGIETVYLDLILQHKEDDEKLTWLKNAEAKLSSMLRSLEHLLAEAAGGDTHVPAGSISAGTWHLLERNAADWNKLTEVEFIRTSPAVDWLGEDFVNHRLLTTAFREKDEVRGVNKDQISLLKNLVAVVDSKEFQQLATQDANNIWNGITWDVFGMASLGEFKESLVQTLDNLKTRLREHSSNPALFKARVERSVSFSNMPTINFNTSAYKDFAKDFRPWIYERESLLDKVGQKLAELFSRAATNPQNPESWLFMAFVMGMLDYWQQATVLASKGLSLVKKGGDKREFQYFIADAKCREASEQAEDPAEALKRYISAYKHIQQAIRLDPSDARFLERQATIALHYHEVREQFAVARESEQARIDGEGKEIVSKEQAIQLLIQAERRAGKDRKLRVRALNNLAFTYVTNEPPQVREAAECIDKIQQEFDEAVDRKDDLLPEPEKWPFVMDTIWYVRALVASANNDVGMLDSTINGLQGVLSNAVLLPQERKIIESHLRKVRELRLTAEVAP